jgi:hypothetical protein
MAAKPPALLFGPNRRGAVFAPIGTGETEPRSQLPAWVLESVFRSSFRTAVVPVFFKPERLRASPGTRTNKGSEDH